MGVDAFAQPKAERTVGRFLLSHPLLREQKPKALYAKHGAPGDSGDFNIPGMVNSFSLHKSCNIEGYGNDDNCNPCHY